MDFRPKAARYLELVFLVMVAVATLGAIGLNLWATIDCAPQAGKWAPWTGQICFGEPK